jgi:hypothetical protein
MEQSELRLNGVLLSSPPLASYQPAKDSPIELEKNTATA